MRSLLAVLTLLFVAPEARADAVADHLDAAASCSRRDRAACTLREASAALEVMDEATPSALRREALRLRAESLALLDRPGEATAAFLDLLDAQPGWRPAEDADARIREAAEAARRKRLLERLPTTLDPGDPRPPEAPAPEELLPDPVLYAPERIVEMDAEEALIPRWRLSLGAGVGLAIGESGERFDPGPTALLDVSRDVVGPLAVWFQVALSLMSFDGGVDVEPGYSRGLTTASGVVGVSVTLPIAGDLSATIAGGLGAGAFGVRSLDEAVGAAFHGSAGVRWQLDESLALRVDAAPTLIVPAGDAIGAGGQLNVVARGEIRF